MADFIIRVLKWLAALVTAYFILFVLLFLFLIGLGVAFQPIPMTVESNSILVLDLGFNLTDRPKSDDPTALIGDALSGELSETASLRQVLTTLERAKLDGAIHGLLIRGNLRSDGYGGSFASLREFREAILAFAESKPVWAYMSGDRLRDYYLKSAANDLISDPQSMLDFRGLRAERLYWGDAFERIGIEVQVEAMGDFKTAGESFKKGSMSEPERQQLRSILDDLWGSIVGDIASARGLEVAALDKVAEKELFIFGQEVVDKHLADELMSDDQLVDHLVSKVGFDSKGETFRQFDFIDYAFIGDPLAGLLDLDSDGSKVAIVYIEGIIVDGSAEDEMVGDESVNRYLRELRHDDSVKAVVLRVNSPGGSATASSRIAREIELTREEKPVVVSMGGIAASGGYMVAAVSDYIFAEPTTITGSIGVVSMLPNIEQLTEKLSLSFEGVETHPFAGSFSLARSKNPEELRQIRALGAQTYDDFLKMVAVNRNMTREELLPLAEGRIWSGEAALKNKLVDESGGLTSAIQRAADMAGIGDFFTVIERPELLSLEQQIEKFLMGVSANPPKTQSPLQLMARELELEINRLGSLNDPYGQYMILPYSLKIN